MDLLAHLKTMVETRKISGAGVLTLDTYNERIQASHAITPDLCFHQLSHAGIKLCAPHLPPVA